MLERKMLEKTYLDKCTIKRNMKVKDEQTGITKGVLNNVYEDIKCGLSKRSLNNLTVEGAGQQNNTFVLFINPTIEIKAGDVIEVKGYNNLMFIASLPMIYPSHQEVPLELKERV